jgi:spore coat polysaccharide biosynthesis protein SpsF (cytidylyltransferase family)
MGLEVFSVRLLRENMELILKNERWYEHVTSYFYNNPERFSIVNLSLKKNLSNIRLTVDEERDWQRLLPLASFFAKRPELLKLRYIVRKYRELVNEND